jgi:hypothetical protein
MPDLPDIEKWRRHNPLSDPGRHVAAIADLPADVGILTGLVGGLLIHTDWLDEYGVDETQIGAVSRTTLPIADRLDDLMRRDGRALHLTRLPGQRSAGTCRDFALTLCSLLRCKDIPARLRCGFAAYLGGVWEDHWVCEYWDEQSRDWHLSDAQIDGVLAAKYGITWERSDVPRSAFISAGQAWIGCRAGRYNAGHFGHGETTGLWFVKVNVWRDHDALNNREVSAWDSWRAASLPERVVGDHELVRLDGLAANPAQPLVEVIPDWLA